MVLNDYGWFIRGWANVIRKYKLIINRDLYIILLIKIYELKKNI